MVSRALRRPVAPAFVRVGANCGSGRSHRLREAHPRRQKRQHRPQRHQLRPATGQHHHQQQPQQQGAGGGGWAGGGGGGRQREWGCRLGGRLGWGRPATQSPSACARRWWRGVRRSWWCGRPARRPGRPGPGSRAGQLLRRRLRLRPETPAAPVAGPGSGRWRRP
jgi:hypothetical protein